MRYGYIWLNGMIGSLGILTTSDINRPSGNGHSIYMIVRMDNHCIINEFDNESSAQIIKHLDHKYLLVF